jgi:sugar phosphate isomerase/epimerase
MSDSLHRRGFLAASAGGALAAAAGFSLYRYRTPAAIAHTLAAPAVRLGVASYSLRRFSRAETIRMVTALGSPYINIKSFHLEYDLPEAELVAGRREFEEAGLTIVGGGTITFDEDTDPGVEKYFAYARAGGMPLIVATCEPSILPRIERFAKQYDIAVAIHNHGPEDRHYPAPADALRYIGAMDPRMGVCVDIGHTVRTGVDVVQAIADAGPRVLDLHIKDLADLSDRDSQCIVGEGAMPIAEIFEQLRRMDFRGYANLEYEIDADDPFPGMRQSFAYMRGVLAGLSAGGGAT